MEVNKKRVERSATRRVEGSGPAAETGRLWFNDGSCVRLRPEYPNHVWVRLRADRTYDGKAYRMLTVIDEFSRECLAIVVGEDQLQRCSLHVGRPVHPSWNPGAYRSDNGPEFCAKAFVSARQVGRGNAVHRAGQSLGEWIHRVVQREAAGRVAEPGVFLQAEGGPCPDRAVAATLQRSKTT